MFAVCSQYVRTTSQSNQEKATPKAEKPKKTTKNVAKKVAPTPINNNFNFIDSVSSEIAYCEKCSLKNERELRYVENEGSGSNGIMLVGQCPGEVEMKRRLLLPSHNGTAQILTLAVAQIG